MICSDFISLMVLVLSTKSETLDFTIAFFH